MSNSITNVLGLRLLKENDVGNFASVNHTLTRLDALSGLTVESTDLVLEPTLTPDDDGKVYAVDASSAQGPFWGTLQDDSLLLWGRTSDQEPRPTAPYEGLYRWHAIPTWNGAYAYDKSTGTFSVYNGDGWSKPSQRKVSSVTLNRELLDSYANAGGTGAPKDWYPLVQLDGPQTLLEVFCTIEYNPGLITEPSAGGDGFHWVEMVANTTETSSEFEGFTYHQDWKEYAPKLPYVLPIIRVAGVGDVNGRLSVVSGWDTEVYVQGQASSDTDDGGWHIPGGPYVEPHPLAGSDQDRKDAAYGLAASMTGLITRFRANNNDYPVVGSSVTPTDDGRRWLVVNLTDVVAGAITGSNPVSVIENITFQVSYTGGSL